MKKLSKKSKKLRIIIISLGILILIGILAIVKAYYLNPPKESPKQITQKIIDFVQKKDVTDADKENIRKYYKSNVLEKFDKDIANSKNENEDESKADVVVTIKSVEEQKNSATATIEMEAWIIKVPIQFKFVKEGNFWKGYKWLIEDMIGLDNDISTNKKESTGKPNEKIAIGGGFGLIISQLSDYSPSNSYDTPDSGMKFVSLEMTYFNDSKQSGDVSPSNLTLRDSDGHSYEITYKTEKKPILENGTVVTAGGSNKGFIVFEIPINAKITNAVYSNSEATITINF